MRLACLFVAVCSATALAQVGSTADEWAERFAPEPGPPPAVPAYADSYDKAAANVTAGRYRAAFSDLAGIGEPDAKRSAFIAVKAHLGLGEISDAVALLGKPPLKDDFDARSAHALLLLDLGKPSEAATIIDGLLAESPANYRAHFLRGRVLEDLGDFKAAVDAYHWFLEPEQDLLHKWQSDPDGFEDAAALTDLAASIHRWATLTSAYKDAQDLNDTVLGMFTRAFDVIDRSYTPARLAAAEFCMSRGDSEKAAAFMAPLEKSMPRSNDFLMVMAQQAASSGRDSALQGIAAKLRENDPESAEASLLEIFALARARAAGTAQRAAKLHEQFPDRPDIAGVDAALASLSGDDGRMSLILKAADQRWPTRSDVYVSAASVLAGAFQRDVAATLLQTAIKRTPWETEPRHLLGDLYLNDGYDDKARDVLEAAKELDPYHLETINYLRLLDELAKYDKRLTEHLIVYSDKTADPIAAEQIGDYLEASYADLCKTFQYTPKTKIVVQIYPDDDAFSVRMAGVPGVENFGVSFGRVLAAIAPRKGTKQGNFNWARVLHHEFVHTFNLLATDNRCPRWLTEGLAVWQERVPFRFDGVAEELYSGTMADELFTIRGFPLAFLRPKRQNDGEQAYTQGAYLAMYLEQTYGTESIVKLLAAYGAGKNDEQAFAAATGKPMSDFENDWHAWMKTRLAPWGYDENSAKQAKAFEDEGEDFIKARDFPQALTMYEQAYAIQPMAVKPHQRLAGLYLQKDLANPAKAIEHLKFLHVLELQDNRYAKQISRLYARLGDNANAAEWAKQATYVDLYDVAAHELLVDAAEKAGDTATAERERTVVNQLKVWDEQRRSNAGN
ncbi:MAG: hypothetical protein QM754_14330 [Tepidisphaeraceae bacterium]